MNDLYILVPESLIGKKLVPAGWCSTRVVPAFDPLDVTDLPALIESVNGWKDEARILVRVLNKKQFCQRKTGPDNGYHGIWFSELPLQPEHYEIIGDPAILLTKNK